MSPSLAEKDRETARRALGARLRQHRQVANRSLQWVADAAGMSRSKLNRLELGQLPASPLDVQSVLTALDVDADAIRTAVAAAKALESGRFAGWEKRSQQTLSVQSELVSLESATGLFKFFNPGLLPGFVQTTAYMRAVYERLSPEFEHRETELEEFLVVRRQRQAALFDSRRRFEFVVTEAGLRSRYLDSASLAEQYQHLLTIGELPHVSLRVLAQSQLLPVLVFSNFEIYDDAWATTENALEGFLVHEPRKVAAFVKDFVQLQRVALDEEASSDLLRRLIEESREQTSTLRSLDLRQVELSRGRAVQEG